MSASPPAPPDAARHSTCRDFASLPDHGHARRHRPGRRHARDESTPIREEPGGTGRLFVTDMNGPIYILDKKTNALTTYLDFNGRDERPGSSTGSCHDAGTAAASASFSSIPDYRSNGRFYTVHMESPSMPGSQRPDNDVSPRAGTRPIRVRTDRRRRHTRADQFESVLIEWTDTNLRNLTFEGTAREIMRVQLNGRIHPMGEVVFHPAARPGDAEWRVMYIGAGDSGAGESRHGDSPEPAAARHARRKDPSHHSRSGRARDDEHAERERPVPDSERQPVCSRSPERGKKSGRTACAIRTG